MTRTQTMILDLAPHVHTVTVHPATPAERVWAALHHIENRPLQWNQRSWNYCLAGWTVRMHRGDGILYGYSEGDVYREFRALTSLGPWRTFNITAAVNTLPRLRRLVRRYFGPDPAER